MNNIDLRGAPFYLNEKEIGWVEKTRGSMTIEEKIGQLFFLIGMNPKDLKDVVTTIQPGGMMYRTAGADKLIKAYKVLQENSHIPMLLAANLEAGGNGLIEEGTDFGPNLQVAATDNPEQAYRLGLICGREAQAVGANMAFAPVIDINYNFRNPITNTRSFGDDPQRVAAMGAAYVKGAHDGGISVTIKHFPGDGTDGRDQHLVTTPNSLSYRDWMETFGAAYKQSIQAGARGLMVGHIAFPAYIQEKYPEQAEKLAGMPATVNPILLQKLLREELGYNGLTMTDASLMTGFGQAGKRSDLVPLTIAAGCDMFLFTRQPKDDYNYMMAGYTQGIITDERLDEAITRILAIKASLGIYNKSPKELVPQSFNFDQREHKQWAKELADQSVTLVQDKQSILPLKPTEKKNIGVIVNGNEGGMETLLKNLPGFKGKLLRIAMALKNLGKKQLKPHEKLIAEFNKRGFNAFEYSFGDILSVMKEMNEPLDNWTSRFDAIIYVAKWNTMSNQTSLQLQYRAAGFDAPWWIHDIPTILVSLANPYHGYDLPMIETVVNAYHSNNAIIESVVEKLCGESEFKGISPVRLDFQEFTGKLPG